VAGLDPRPSGDLKPRSRRLPGIHVSSWIPDNRKGDFGNGGQDEPDSRKLHPAIDDRG